MSEAEHPATLIGPAAPRESYVLRLDDLGLEDVARVGGKTASLGELRRLLRGQAVGTPDGFAVTVAP